jgi:hypothetical protein
MKKLLNLFLICFILLTGCYTTGVKSSNLKPVKPIPRKELVLTTPRSEQLVVKTNSVIITNVPAQAVEKKSFLSFKSPKEAEKTKPIILPNTNVVASIQITNTPTTNEVIKAINNPTKKKDWKGFVAYYSIVLSIGAIWFFYGRTKLKALGLRLLGRSQKR